MVTSVSQRGAVRRVADPTAGFRRVASAPLLPIAFALQVATNTMYALVTMDGGSDSTGRAAMELFGGHPGFVEAATLTSSAGCLLAIPGLLMALRVLRPHRPRLALSAVTLMITGYVCYFGIVSTNQLTLQLALLAPEQGAAVSDAANAMASALPVFLLFVLGNLVGTALLGAAALGDPRLPRWAGIAILGWPVGHIVNILLTSEWFAVAGGVLEVAGFAALALTALRMSDEEWVRRG